MTFNITIQKLEIFDKYGGSSYDHAKNKHLKILPYNEYVFIERVVQDIKLIERGLAAVSYQEQVNNRIKENFDSQDTIRHLRNIAMKL